MVVLVQNTNSAQGDRAVGVVRLPNSIPLLLSGGLNAKPHVWMVKWRALHARPSFVGTWKHKRFPTLMVFHP